MKNETSYKLDGEARLWLRPADGPWRPATSEEADRIFLCYPEFAAQAFWLGQPRPRARDANAATPPSGATLAA